MDSLEAEPEMGILMVSEGVLSEETIQGVGESRTEQWKKLGRDVVSARI